jgi:hypothetical protein
MALSDDEQSRLDELGVFTQAADPSFAARLGTATVERWERRQVALAWSASLLGILAMLSGFSAARGLISIGSIIVLYGFLVAVWGAAATVQIIRRKIAQADLTKKRG